MVGAHGSLGPSRTAALDGGVLNHSFLDKHATKLPAAPAGERVPPKVEPR